MPASSPDIPDSAGVELHAGSLRLALRPDLGGSVAGLWHHGVAVLRSVEPALLQGPRQSACFPLVPYSNRLGYRRFRWQGREYTTRPNFDGEATPHSLHGVAWRREWRVEAATANEALLRYDHAADEHWPFAFTASQLLRLDQAAVEFELSVENRADIAAPVGLGWHPYFPKRASSCIALDVAARWDADAMQLPSARVPHSPLGAAVESLDLDHCFDGWPGSARIDDELFSLTLVSSLQHVVIFTPPSRPHFCIEPVSHVNNAINLADPLAHGIVAVAPGARLSATMRLGIIDKPEP